MVWKVMAVVVAGMVAVPPLTTLPYSPPHSPHASRRHWNRLPHWACPIPESVKSQVGWI